MKQKYSSNQLKYKKKSFSPQLIIKRIPPYTTIISQSHQHHTKQPKQKSKMKIKQIKIFFLLAPVTSTPPPFSIFHFSRPAGASLYSIHHVT